MSNSDAVRSALKERWPSGRLPWGALSALATEFGLSRQRVHTIAHRAGFAVDAIRNGGGQG